MSPPSKSGITTSSRMRSGRNALAVSKARDESFSSQMSYSDKVSLVSLVKLVSSSTIRILGFLFLIFSSRFQNNGCYHPSTGAIGNTYPAAMHVDDGLGHC